MLIHEVTNAGAMPVLAQVMAFSAQRQRFISHNIANITTPNFQQKDASPEGFQSALREAIDARRARTGGAHGEIRLPETDEIRFDERGRMTLSPQTPSGGLLFHDRNNRSLERLMQAQAENAGMFRVATTLMRSQGAIIQSAIRESP